MNPTPKATDAGSSLAFLILRLWLGVRALVAGIEKFAGTSVSDQGVTIDGQVNDYGLTSAQADKTYGLGNYSGVPEALYNRFVDEPLIPQFALAIFDRVLGPALIVLGVTLLLGIAVRSTLFLMGLLYTSLTIGLILIKQDAGVAWLGIHVLLVAAALRFVNDNRFTLMKKW